MWHINGLQRINVTYLVQLHETITGTTRGLWWTIKVLICPLWTFLPSVDEMCHEVAGSTEFWVIQSLMRNLFQCGVLHIHLLGFVCQSQSKSVLRCVGPQHDFTRDGCLPVLQDGSLNDVAPGSIQPWTL